MQMSTVGNLPFAINLAATLGCGLMAGFYFAFSVSVMNALGRLSPAEGITTMQSINIAVINPVFLAGFLGTAILCILAMVTAVMHWSGPGVILAVIGGVLYLVGSIAVTAFINIPMNNEMAALVPANADSATYWASYLTNWTAWNHLRSAICLVASALFIIALAL
jgi:uncharacterized membrane protein